jgi:hypothetical protein
MTRKRKLDEELWEDGEEQLSADHVVERFFSQHEHDDPEDQRRLHPAGARPKRRAAPPDAPETEE